MSPGPTIEVRDLRVRYDRFTLGPVSFSLEPGERVALVGPNGAGKSTTLAALSGRWTHYEGSVRVLGYQARSAPAKLRGSVGVLSEELLGFGWMTVAEHLALLADVYDGWDDAYARELAHRLEVPRSTRLANLSRGNRMKVSLLSAEAFRPAVLLLDEPTSGVDPVMRSELLRLLDACAPRGGPRTVVFSTHILEDVEAAADRVLLLRDGRILLDEGTVPLRDRSRGVPLSAILLHALART